jgi:hypothetical protein
MVMAPRRMTAAGEMTFEGDVDLKVEKLISKPGALQAKLGAMVGSKRAGPRRREQGVRQKTFCVER